MRIFKRGRVSSTGLRLAAVVGLAAVLGACHGTELAGVKNLEPQGSEFNQQLFAGYVELSAKELAENDYRDSDRFAMRAAAAARGDDVRPTDVDQRLIAATTWRSSRRREAGSWRCCLGAPRARRPPSPPVPRSVTNAGCRSRRKGTSRTTISACRNAFYGQLIAAEVAIRPAPPPPPEPAPAAEPEPEPVYATYYVVFFDFDSSELSNAAKQTLDEATEAALAMRPYKIIIRGHTDRAGPDKYNLGLSERRALSVAGYMIDQGAGRFVIDAEGLGESEADRQDCRQRA